MSTFTRTIVLLGTCALAGLAAPEAAGGSRIAAALGAAQNGGYDHCFDRAFGQIASHCLDQQTRLHVTPPQSQGTDKKFYATGCSSTSHRVTSCAIVIDDYTGWGKAWSSDVRLSTSCPSSAPTRKQLGGVFTVGPGDMQHFECLLWGAASPFETDYVGTLDY